MEMADDATLSNVKGHRVVPWSSWIEWKMVKDLMLSEDPKEQQVALKWAVLWETRNHNIPTSVETTSNLVEALFLNDQRLHARNDISEKSIRLQLSLVILRYVNGMVDSEYGNQTVRKSAEQLGISSEAVDLRHQATHGALPCFELVQKIAKETLNRLKDIYWDVQDSVLSSKMSEQQYLNISRKLSTSKAIAVSSLVTNIVPQSTGIELQKRLNKSTKISFSGMKITEDVITQFVVPAISRGLLSKVVQKEGSKELTRLFSSAEQLSWLSTCRKHLSKNVKFFGMGPFLNTKGDKPKQSLLLFQDKAIDPPNLTSWAELIKTFDLKSPGLFLKSLIHNLLSIIILYKADQNSFDAAHDHSASFRTLISKLDFERCLLVSYSWIIHFISKRSLTASLLENIINTCSSNLNDMTYVVMNVALQCLPDSTDEGKRKNMQKLAALGAFVLKTTPTSSLSPAKSADPAPKAAEPLPETSLKKRPRSTVTFETMEALVERSKSSQGRSSSSTKKHVSVASSSSSSSSSSRGKRVWRKVETVIPTPIGVLSDGRFPTVFADPFHFLYHKGSDPVYDVETFVSRSSPIYAGLLGIGADVSSGESEEEDNVQETSSNSNPRFHSQDVEDALDREQILKDQRKNLCIELLL